MKQLKLYSAVSLGLLMSAAAANADIRFNGFASVFGGFTTGSDDTFLGYDDSFSADPDTIVGLQAVADLDDGLSVTVQLTARGDEDYEVDLEWGYLTYQVNDQIRINAGRIRSPFFNRSDFLDVGYAYYWARPPTRVYGVGFSNITGASIQYDTSVGTWDITGQVLAGRQTNSLTIGGQDSPFDAENFAGIAIEGNRDWLTLRTGYFRANLTLDSAFLDGPLDGFRAAGFGDVSDVLDIQDDTGTFLHFGLGIDKNDFLFNAEWRVIEVEDGLFQEATAWYASAGYRFGAWTPNVTYEQVDSDVPSNISSVVGAAPAPIQAGAAGLIGAFSSDNSAVSFGVRYDFHPSAAFKIDFTTFDDDLNEANDADLLTVGVDLIF